MNQYYTIYNTFFSEPATIEQQNYRSLIMITVSAVVICIIILTGVIVTALVGILRWKKNKQDSTPVEQVIIHSLFYCYTRIIDTLQVNTASSVAQGKSCC